MRYPAAWATDSVAREGDPSYRFFAPPGDRSQATPTSVSLLVEAAAGSLDDYAQPFVEGANVTSREDVLRQGLKGRRYRYERGAARYVLLLLPGKGVAHGLFVQGDEAGLQKHQRALDEMASSFTIERPSTYAVHRDERFGFALRIPPGWTQGRKLSSTAAGMAMVQFLSPAIGVDRDGSTVHTSLTVSAEPLVGTSLQDFYDATRRKLGDAYKVNRHAEWRGGYLDLETIETPMAISDAKRFYWVSKDRGYTLVFEGREDVFHRVSAWCDLIASTFEVLPPGGP